MRASHIIGTAFLAALLGGSPQPLGGQPNRASYALTLNGMPHPASAALALWDSLHLSEAQIDSLRAIEEKVSKVLVPAAMERYADSAGFFQLWRKTTIDTAEIRRRALRDVDMAVRLEVAMLRARDDVFRILTPGQFARLDSIIMGKSRHADAAFSRRGCTSGGVGGGGGLSETIELIYALEFERDSARIRTVFLAKSDGARRSSSSVAPMQMPSHPTRAGGGTAGRWWLQADSKGEVAWMDTTAIPLHGGNVVLLQGFDRVTRPPDVVGVARVPARFWTNGCRDEDFGKRLQAHLLASPEVRAFLGR